MATRAPKLADETPISISSRDSSSSEEPGCRPRLPHPRRATLSTDQRSPIETSLSYEPLATGGQDTAPPVHPLVYAGAGRFYKPGLEDQWRKKHLRERASWSNAFPRPGSSRSTWPSSSTRDLLKEAGEWLDAEYPLPDVQIPDTEWHLASSPRSEGFFSSSSLGSRPTTPSTLKEEVDGADEKIVYIHREAKLRELLEKMQQDFNRGNGVNNGREAKVRNHLKEVQHKNEERAAQVESIVQQPLELDTLGPREGGEHSMTSNESSRRSFPPSNSSHGSADEAQVVPKQPSDQTLQSPTAYIELKPDIHHPFSAAITQVLNLSDLPELERLETRVDGEAEQTPAEVSNSRTEFIDPSSRNYASTQDVPSRPDAETAPALKSKLDRDSSISAAQPVKISSSPIVRKPVPTTAQSKQIRSLDAKSPVVLPSTPLPQPESQAVNCSVFSDLEELVGAFRARRRTHPGGIPADPG